MPHLCPSLGHVDFLKLTLQRCDRLKWLVFPDLIINTQKGFLTRFSLCPEFFTCLSRLTLFHLYHPMEDYDYNLRYYGVHAAISKFTTSNQTPHRRHRRSAKVSQAHCASSLQLCYAPGPASLPPPTSTLDPFPRPQHPHPAGPQ
ncbi:hypothetical protein BDP27DRAFT_1429322 [Rhodocollybia butyracea]|uniref:Uncharacterized protein n=1 Tax=Rhodocollybia butyracea TaxID=206335 RepID=A0A9P5PE92_9AGAR|nr:hypothetical protein BDP27DRAFT_1429322 [Rhodocollybia butyracea]